MLQTMTTQHVADLCCVTRSTVAKWCNSGLLSCSRMPHSKTHHRRITREAFRAFAMTYGMHYAVDKLEKEDGVKS